MMANIKLNQSILLSPLNASRGIVICDVDEEEPKTILEIGGMNSRSPPYTAITPLPQRSGSSGSWTEPVPDVVPPPYSPYPEATEHKIIPMTNASWATTVNVPEKCLTNAERGKCEANLIPFHNEIGDCRC